MRPHLPGRLAGVLPICLALAVFPTSATPVAAQSTELTGPGPLQIDDVVSEALARNPSIFAAEHRWSAVAALPDGVRSLPDPTLRFGLYDQPVGSLDPLDGQLRLQLTQPLPHPGTLERRAAVVEREADRMAVAIPASRVRVAAMARRAYYDLYLAERAGEIHHGHLELVRELSVSTEERYAAGDSPQESVLRALQELTQLFTELTSVERDVVTARAALNRVLHRAPNAPLGSPTATPLDGIPEHGLEDLLAAAERLSPELEEARAAVAREAARVASDRHEAKPDFGVILEWWTAPDGMGGRRERYAILGTLTLPWLHDDKYTAAVAAAIAARAAAESEVSVRRDRVLEVVATAWERARTAARIAELYRTTLLPQSEQSLLAAKNAYETGRADFVTVVDSERTLLLNRLGLARFEAEHGRAMADLLEAVGVTQWDEIAAGDAMPEAMPDGPGGRLGNPVDAARRVSQRTPGARR